MIKQNKISHDYFTSNTLQFRQKRKSHQRHFHSDKQLSFSKPDENGKLVYQGDQTVSATGVGDQSAVDINRSGTNPFDKIVRLDENNKKMAVGFFQVIDDLSAALQSNNSGDIKRAVGEMTTLQQGLSDSLASIGAATNKIDNQASLAEENVLRMKSTLSQVEDTDYTEAITKMNKDILALQAAQSSFAKIAQLNLFDYIK